MPRRTHLSLMTCLFIALLVSACNLSTSNVVQETLEVTGTRTISSLVTLTPNTTGSAPTTLPLTNLAPTLRQPTSVVLVPVTAVFPTAVANTALPVSIVILSPVPGNVVAGNVQVLGAAAHPQFLQYQLEFGPDPNPSQLWYQATNVVQQPIINGLLGVWNTTATQDGLYQLRLRVFLRDGTTLSTVVGNVRVQNNQPTPVPSATQNVPRPIAAFTQDVASGQVPLTVRFTNQSSGTITNITWNFGDGQSSSESSPAHTFNGAGLYNVTLTVTGPGGASNVSRQISVQSQSAPTAAFTQDTTSGSAPLTVRFSNQSSGNITSLLWNFSDGTVSTESNPAHTFSVPGTYNVFLTVTGPGGSASTTRQVVVAGPPTATWTATWTAEPPTATFTPEPSAELPTATCTLEPTATETLTETPTETPAEAPTETPTETPTDTPLVESVIDPIPLVPDLAPSTETLRNYYNSEAAQGGRQVSRFSIAGDETLTRQGVLDPFASGGYNLGANSQLQGLVDFYNTEAANTFGRDGAATGANWTANELLNGASGVCPGQTHLACELSSNNPAVLLISVGYYDALNGTPADVFEAALRSIVETATASGTIPVLLTVASSDQLDPQAVNAINTTILNVANQYQLPLINAGLAINQSPNGFSEAEGGGNLDLASQYGVNAVNLHILQTLKSLLDIVAPGTVQ